MCPFQGRIERIWFVDRHSKGDLSMSRSIQMKGVKQYGCVLCTNSFLPNTALSGVQKKWHATDMFLNEA